MEIYRKEWETSKGEEVRTTQAEFLKDGTLRISSADFGPLVETYVCERYPVARERCAAEITWKASSNKTPAS